MKRFAIVITSLITISVDAQNYDLFWAFGDSAGIDFSDTANPIPITTSSAFDAENNNSISNSSGQPLLYLGGDSVIGGWNSLLRVFDASGNLMFNGDSLITNYNEANGSVILPSSSDSNELYIFHLGSNPPSISSNTFFQTKINKTMNGGLGAVVSKNLIIAAADSYSYKLTAVRHANGRDWWLLLHFKNQNIFEKFLMTPGGLNGPTFDTTGILFSSLNFFRLGEIAPSPDGTLLALANYNNNIELYSFNRCTGATALLKNLSSYISPASQVFPGIAISSNNKFVYCSTGDAFLGSYSQLFQINILDIDNISSQLIYTVSDSLSMAQLQMGPDGKIYVGGGVYGPTVQPDSAHLFLSVINSPDSAYPACNFQPHSFYLGGHKEYGGLPNMPNYRLGALAGSPCDTLGLAQPVVKDQWSVVISPNPAHEQCTVHLLIPGNPLGVLQMYNILGQEVYAAKFRRGEQALSIPLASIPVGIYLVKVEANGWVKSCKLVKE